MKYRIVITAEAKIDIAEAVQWYERQGAGLGRHFWQALKSALRDLRENPLIYRAWGSRQFRKLRVRRYPYSASYEVCSEDIRIHAVFHASRDPAVLKSRLR